MKLKTILIILVVILFVFLIYIMTVDKKVYYLNLNDNYMQNEKDYSFYYKEYLKKENKLEKYINDFNLTDYRITDLIRSIEDNEQIIIDDKVQTIKNALIKADLITFSIGMNDINYKIATNSQINLYDYVDEILKDMEVLFILMREYSKEDIIFIGLYNIYEEKYNKIFNYLNDKINALCNEYNIKFLDINNIINGEKINEKQHVLISESIKKIIDF